MLPMKTSQLACMLLSEVSLLKLKLRLFGRAFGLKPRKVRSQRFDLQEQRLVIESRDDVSCFDTVEQRPTMTRRKLNEPTVCACGNDVSRRFDFTDEMHGLGLLAPQPTGEQHSIHED